MKKLILLIGIGLVLIQFFQPDKNISVQASENAIEKKYNVPINISSLLKTSCYDCHSNNTNYPWYNNVQPVAWWLNKHIKDGKRHLNFDEFNTYSAEKKKKKLAEIIETIEKKEMPLSSYTVIHSDARLTLKQQKEICDWANTLRKSI